MCYYRFYPNEAKFKAKHLCSSGTSKDSVCRWQCMYISAFPTSFYHKYCGSEVTVHRVMWESTLVFLGTFCHREESLESLGLFFYFGLSFFFLFKPLNSCVSKIKIKIKPFGGCGKVEWPQSCDFWALKGAAALLSPTYMDAVCCGEISPKLQIHHQRGS